MGRDALRLRRAPRRSRRDGGRDHRLVQAEARPIQMPAPRRLRRIAQDLDRQDPEIQAARAGEGRLIRSPSRRRLSTVPLLGYSKLIVAARRHQTGGH